MAKFTVFFKDKPIHSSIFESGNVHIGRDETNDLAVDSLAIAPAHAVVVLRNSPPLIKQLNSDFPLIINGIQHKETMLQDGDTITIGKHRIVYSSTEKFASTLSPKHPEEPENEKLNQEFNNRVNLPEANLQVMGGKHIGRLIPLKKTMIRLGREGSGIIVITRRKEGYFVSMLEVNNEIKINGTELADQTLLLKNNDTLIIDKIPMQFFMD
ncbi:MAG: FHA domain-containing protein [Methyloprofundus sp.]|nr:FHA domain-containing protein [Methyloprofundus sp.]MDT8424373.1 FHA domain-containing protein [Methyloprofundus sp.]